MSDDQNTYTIPDFGPADLLDSEKIGIRRVKVVTESDGQFMAETLYSIQRTNLQILEQMRLLNARFEESFPTSIRAEDLENG